MSQNNLRILDTESATFETAFRALLERDKGHAAAVDEEVREIIDKVRAEGDSALLAFTQRFDGVNAESVAALEFPQERIAQAEKTINTAERDALDTAARRIRDFHERQLQTSWEYVDTEGTMLGQRVTPLDRVGLYVPGGKASYPSSVLMAAIPAVIAGVGELLMVVPTPEGQTNELVLAAAGLVGVHRVFALGGAQAIAALAYGTETIPAVDKIVGPGNIYVATAKRIVFGRVGIDMIAGPSEVVVVCDETADPHWVAMDLFAQAEHDEQAQSIMITSSPALADRVAAEIRGLLPTMRRRTIIRKALANQGAIICVRHISEAVELVNRIAPEHLELLVREPRELAAQVRNAGAIFLGVYSPESLGDYMAGPNHVLPTTGTARFSSPLGVYDFQKRSSLIMCSKESAARLAENAAVLARSEQLEAHALSAELRMNTSHSSP